MSTLLGGVAGGAAADVDADVLRGGEGGAHVAVRAEEDDEELREEEEDERDAGAELERDARADSLQVDREVDGEEANPHDARGVHREADELGLVKVLGQVARFDRVQRAQADEQHVGRVRRHHERAPELLVRLGRRPAHQVRHVEPRRLVAQVSLARLRVQQRHRVRRLPEDDRAADHHLHTQCSTSSNPVVESGLQNTEDIRSMSSLFNII